MHYPTTALVGQEEKIHTPAISDCTPKSAQSRMPLGSARSTPVIHSGAQNVHAVVEPRKTGTGTRNRFVKVRLSPAEYADVATRADTQGITLCEHIRQQLLAVHEALDVRSELRALRDQMTNSGAIEAVLILRELAAIRDAQILGRVRAQMNAAGDAR